MNQYKDQRSTGVGGGALAGMIASLEVPEQSSQHGSQYKDQQKVRRPSTVRRGNSNAKPLPIEPKEPEIPGEDLSLAENGSVNCFGSLEGVTMMRDMDWR